MKTKSTRFKQSPRAFRAITGISVEKFNELSKELLPLYEKSEIKRLSKSKRQRKIGGGRKKRTFIRRPTDDAFDVLPIICIARVFRHII